ncbi:MAG: chlorophyll synthase ChlG [Betaproteobacteria bacterium]|jgi:chlorophyll/bacteriochlorophyll a synthase|nr:chlorophyll synthase ChlG [Betaproteobacteria bacterium]
MNQSVTTRASPDPMAVAELLKPITWFPPMWAFTCGVIASDIELRSNWHLILIGLLLTGPLVCASSQAVNDWFDRHVDAINEPGRPIPSGRLPGRWGLAIAVIWSGLSLIIATGLGPWGFAATVLALMLAWAYSMPPLRLKENGWLGNAACGLSYESLAWITGSAVMMGGVMPASESMVLALLYGIGAHGIMTLNDFKSIAGDRQMGVRSLPVQLGATRAAGLACWTMALPQAIVIGLLFSWGAAGHAIAVLLLLLAQAVMMRWFVRQPIERALFYSGFGVPIYVCGMMVSAFALRSAL